jgi:hypothetical protein
MKEKTMSSSLDLGVPKVHPLDREMLPEDPLEMQAFEVPGDTDLMFRVVIEEFARMGSDKATIIALARDPFYAALHGMWRLYGEERFSQRVSQILAKVGVVRVRIIERPVQNDLLQIEARV